MPTLQWQPVEPIYGPPCPSFCPPGPEGHNWRLSIEEGNITLTSDCAVCNHGIAEVWDLSSDVEMPPILVKLEVETERTIDDVWSWLQLTPHR